MVPVPVTRKIGPQETGQVVPIPADADFTFAVRSTGDPFPDGSHLELRLRGDRDQPLATWAGTRDPDNPNRMVWEVDETDVAAALTLGRPRKVRVHYIAPPTVNLLWVVWQAQVI